MSRATTILNRRTIPPERWETMREAYASMQKLLSVLADPLAYADEPAVPPDLTPRGRR